jgi:hypothetical protein
VKAHSAASLLLLLVVVLVFGFGTAAQAERPGWYSNAAISGQPHVGATILGSPGGIKCEPECVGLLHEWTSCAGPGSAGADRPTGGLPFDGRPAPGCVVRTRGDLNFRIGPEDAGRHIQLHVIATNYDCGNVRTDGAQECNFSSGHAYSATIGPVAGSVNPSPIDAPVAPRNTAPPIVLGFPRASQPVTVTTGDWTGTEPLRFSYRWLRCSNALGGCPPIPGATAAIYRPGEGDVGVRLKVIVVASNGAGSAWATAAPTEPVVASDVRAPDAVDVRELTPSQRLVIASVASPRTARRFGTAVIRVRVTDTRGVLIRGATVQVLGKRGQVARVTAKTSASGVGVLRVRLLPSVRRGRLVLTVMALKSPRDPRPAVKQILLSVRL